jgi:hypothetical protein
MVLLEVMKPKTAMSKVMSAVHHIVARHRLSPLKDPNGALCLSLDTSTASNLLNTHNFATIILSFNKAKDTTCKIAYMSD